ncbi:N-terminal amidase [Colletotrichum plurivorum]|uniref:N-terminal amidase n=1 Tax=Colletotrichum plurivorum TaxID=2175906 RepID=A0A8H6KR38_9PEZI|nr:N-terminal amidase [Colletotrichum plurivorum]
MRIGCLQFAPQVGDVDNNLNRADSVLSKADADDLDLLVLPELAFSGYNFKSLQQISPFLEHSGSGITSFWARTTALKYNCNVVVGYPEKVDVSHQWPTGPEYYNSAIVVNGDGETIANYRKSFLYYTDETWALEGNNGFYEGWIPGLGNTSIGICQLNDVSTFLRTLSNGIRRRHGLEFQAPWHAFEFAFHILECESNLVIISMAWMTREDGRMFSRMPNEPDMDTLTYWVTRLEPLIRKEGKDEIIVVFCNRTGTEDDVVYAGTSAVVGVQEGEVKIYGLLGRGEKELLVVDTNNPPYAKLVYRLEPERPSAVHSELQQTADVPPFQVLVRIGIFSKISEVAKVFENGESAVEVTELEAGPCTAKYQDTPYTRRTRVSPRHSDGLSSTITSNPRPPEDSTPYPLSGAPLSGYPTKPFERRIYGGSVSISQMPFTPITPFDEHSPQDGRYFWRPSETALKSPMDSWPRTAVAEPDDTRTLSFHFPLFHEQQPRAHSSNSVRTATTTKKETIKRVVNNVPKDRKRALSQNAKVRQSSKSRTRDPRGDPPASSSSQENFPARPSSPKSRNASRSRTHERSNSAMAHREHATAVSQQLETISKRAESANRNRNVPGSGGTPQPDRPSSPKSRNCSRSRPNEALSSILIAASPSILGEEQAQALASVLDPPKAVSHRPSSRMSYRARAGSALDARPPSRGSIAGEHAGVRSSSRAPSRGRQPGPNFSPPKMSPYDPSAPTGPSSDEIVRIQRDRKSSIGSKPPAEPSASDPNFHRVESMSSPAAANGVAATDVISGNHVSNSPQFSVTPSSKPSDVSSLAETIETISTTSRSPSTPFFEPKTPEAMVTLREAEAGSNGSTLPLLPDDLIDLSCTTEEQESRQIADDSTVSARGNSVLRMLSGWGPSTALHATVHRGATTTSAETRSRPSRPPSYMPTFSSQDDSGVAKEDHISALAL